MTTEESIELAFLSGYSTGYYDGERHNKADSKKEWQDYKDKHCANLGCGPANTLTSHNDILKSQYTQTPQQPTSQKSWSGSSPPCWVPAPGWLVPAPFATFDID